MHLNKIPQKCKIILCISVKFGIIIQEVKTRSVSAGIRINPMCSTQEGHEIYDPCAFDSRLGVTRENFREDYAFGDVEIQARLLEEDGVKVTDGKVNLEVYGLKY